MYKLLTFSGYDNRTGPHIFPIEADVDKSIGHIKMARELPASIEQYIRNSKPVKGKTQLLIDAMGAGEFYGSNVNGDFFPEEALRHEGPDYGYRTFMMYAYPFKHHVNKDPARAYGDKVVLSSYDPKMHRVLLIVRVDDAKCQDILGDLDDGTYWDVSMGCRVPWDECSICHNRAKNRAEYCTHLRYQMNKILQDGKRVFAYNRLPKFFDISFVTIGAEKASHILKKVAHTGRAEELVLSSDAGEHYYSKLADVEKAAEQSKRAEIEKEVPSQPAANIQPATPADKAKVEGFLGAAGALKSCERPIPNQTLDRMAQHPMRDIFTTLATLGVDLRPNEFQRIVLMKQGAAKLASALEQHRLVFDETKPATSIPKWAMDFKKINHGAINEKVAMIIQPWLKERSCYPDILQKRIGRMEKQAELDFKYDSDSQWHPMTDDQKREASGMHGLVPASAALAAGFMVFRKIFPGLQTTGPAPIRAIAKHPWLLPMLIGAGVGASVGMQTMNAPMPLTKEGGVARLDAKKVGAYHGANGASENTSSPLHHGMITLAYVYSNTTQNKQRGQYDQLITQRPELAKLSKVANHQTRHSSQDVKIADSIRRTESKRK